MAANLAALLYVVSGVLFIMALRGLSHPTSSRQGNRYGMPFLLQPAEFAERAYRAIDAGSSYRVIPWQMGVVAKLLRVLPNAVFDRGVQGRGRKKRRGEQ